MNLEQLKKLIPSDYKKHASRDLCIFTTSVFGETYTKSFKELFGFEFPNIFWAVRKGNYMTFYRSEREHQYMRRKLGEKVASDKYSKFVIKRLTELTDWFNEFMKNNQTLELFNKHKQEFVDNYREFFAFHQIVYWGGDYMLENMPELKEIIKGLQKVYAYNEKVVPDAEKYLAELGIDHLTYRQTEDIDFEEVGFLFRTDDNTIIIKGDKLDDFENYIINLQKVSDDVKEFQGIAVSKGNVKGPIQIISNPHKLHKAKEGHIIVTGMTRPQFNHILSKTLGIITEEGNILCHAAILSRETGLPVVTGVKHSTEIFQDGDYVELDADSGVVRRIM